METIEIEDQYYIRANSSFTDTRVKILKQGESFGVFDFFGDIHQLGQGTQGIYHRGTRFLSQLNFYFENNRPLLLSSNTSENNEVLSVDLNNPDFPNKKGETISQGKIHILREKFLHKAVAYERISFRNFALSPMDIDIKIKFDSDFADIFEVRGTTRDKKGKLHRPKTSKNEILLGYLGLDEISRYSRIHFTPDPDVLFESEMHHNIQLDPQEVFHLDISIAFEIDEDKPKIYSYDVADKKRRHNNELIKKNSANITTSNEQFNDWINRSKADIITMVTQTDHGPYPYAGVPWFNAPFGRDGIITALECLWIEPRIAMGALKYLAATQALETDDFRDAQPGKILHEKREGEMAKLNEVPFEQYYGTVDATPLFVCLAGAYYDRTADIGTIKEIWTNIEKAMEWIEIFGDIDKDGFVEYERKSSKGLSNQGWKDSFDSVFYKNGKLVNGPVALCEVQAYVYEAKLQAAKLARLFNFHNKAEKWEKEARQLKTNFNKEFWSEKNQTYILALDGEKQQCDVVSSNAGQCLFSGIATKPHAKKVAESMLKESMFTGWGVRTLSSEEIRYNPMSYHNGSIWPHDNALIAYGLSKTGFQEKAAEVMTGMFDTSIFETDQRLPELFCGFNRRKGSGPTAYPVACSPQAWAVASLFLLLQSTLGLEINAEKNQIVFRNPFLPSYLDEIIIENLQISSNNQVDLQIIKKKSEIQITNLSKNSDVDLKVISV